MLRVDNPKEAKPEIWRRSTLIQPSAFRHDMPNCVSLTGLATSAGPSYKPRWHATRLPKAPSALTSNTGVQRAPSASIRTLPIDPPPGEDWRYGSMFLALGFFGSGGAGTSVRPQRGSIGRKECHRSRR